MDIFTELSLIVLIATAIAAVMRLLKQPLIMGHIITGLIVGSSYVPLTHSSETTETFAKMGISILLFIVGLGLSPKVIKEVGPASLITGLGQILFTTFFGFLLALLFRYSVVEAAYIAIALTFSSTIIVLKLITDKKDTQKLYARVAIGFLLVQDIVATLILLFVSSFSSGESASIVIITTLLKGIGITALLLVFSMIVMPKLSDFFATSQEFLFLFSIGWGFGMAMLFAQIGFSIEIGALIAGVVLSVSPYAQEIGTKLKPLRDFFIIMFFVLLGSRMSLDSVWVLLPQAVIFSLFVLVGNPLIVVVLMSILGYNKKTSFLSGLTVAQISEFSMILVLLALDLGHVSPEILALVTLVGLITIAGSTYLIIYAEKIYPYVSHYIDMVQKKRPKKSTTDLISSYDVILFGCNRVGYDFLKLFKRLGPSFLVVDFDPDVVKSLQAEGVNAVFGDAEDPEFLDEINVDEAKMLISTIPTHEVNTFLVTYVRKFSEKPIMIMLSYNVDNALVLYELGASYVVLPHFVGGHFAALLSKRHGFDGKLFKKEREQHIDYLLERKRLGHMHPLR